jgi:hypothetical protein
MDSSPVYAASAVLNPALKWKYFESQWTQPNQRQWLGPTKAFIEEFWHKEYQQNEAMNQPPAEDPLPTSLPYRRRREPGPGAQFVPPLGFYDNPEVAATRDELKDYLKIPPKPCDNPLEWWRQHREEFPVLSKMALDLLSVPLMSAECERVFSAAKNLITDRRNGLKDDIIEACTLLWHWHLDNRLQKPQS